MKKIRKIFNYLLIFCFITIGYSIIFTARCSFGNVKMTKKSDLISAHNIDLDGVDKIIIESTKWGGAPYQHTVITDKKIINKIVIGLKNTVEIGNSLMEDEYNISFWRDDQKLLVLGLTVFFDHPKSGFFRYREDSIHDYKLSSKYCNFLAPLLSLGKKFKALPR